MRCWRCSRLCRLGTAECQEPILLWTCVEVHHGVASVFIARYRTALAGSLERTWLDHNQAAQLHAWSKVLHCAGRLWSAVCLLGIIFAMCGKGQGGTASTCVKPDTALWHSSAASQRNCSLPTGSLCAAVMQPFRPAFCIGPHEPVHMFAGVCYWLAACSLWADCSRRCVSGGSPPLSVWLRCVCGTTVAGLAPAGCATDGAWISQELLPCLPPYAVDSWGSLLKCTWDFLPKCTWPAGCGQQHGHELELVALVSQQGRL